MGSFRKAKTSRRALLAGLALLTLLVGQTGHAAPWAPQSSEWPTFRGSNTHTGASPLTSAYVPGPGGAAKVKWSKTIGFPVAAFPPNVADLNGDGVQEILVTSEDVRIQPGPPPTFSFNHRVQTLSGPTGNNVWSQDEANSFVFVNGANAMDLDGDANGEVVYFAGNPLTGTSATNGLVARAGESGAQQFKFSDNLNWRADQQALGVLTAAEGGNVDADASNEGVFVVSLANFVVTTKPACSGDPNPIVVVTASNIHSFVHAVNGTATSASNSWFRSFDPGLIASTPLIADLNGDGKNEVLFGSGVPEGALIDGCEVQVVVDSSAEDNKVVAINGANPPNSLWEFNLEDPAGTERAPAATPVLAGSTVSGDPIVVFQVPVPESAPDANDDYNILLGLNGRTGAELWRKKLDSADIIPLAAADLDNDGQPEIIVQRSNRLATFRNRDGADFWSQGTGDGRGIPFTKCNGGGRGLTSAGVAVADLDADGVMEIAAILDSYNETCSPNTPADLLVVNGANGATEWTTPIVYDDVIAGPVIADVDGDDGGLAEIVVGSGALTVTDGDAHTGLVTVFEPNVPDLTVTAVASSGNRLVGSAQTVQATVKNLGARDITGAPFRLLDNGVPVGADQTKDIAAGVTETVSFAWTPSTTGSHTLTVVADPASAVAELVETNNQGSSSVNILPIPNAPVINAPAEGALLNTASVTVSGTADANAIVKLFDAGSPAGQTTASGTGAWSRTQPYADGTHAMTATGTDEAGNESPPSNLRTFTVDATAPAPPVITAPAEGAVFGTTTVTVSGTAEPNTAVKVYDGATQVYATTADGLGAWTDTRTYAEGTHALQATATDAANNTSLRSATRTFTVDVSAAPPVITSPVEGAFLNSTSVTISGSAEPGALVVVDEGGVPVGTTTAGTDGKWSVPGTFAEGAHSVAAQQTDAIGNVSLPSALRNFTVDLAAPAPPVITVPTDGASLAQNTVTVAGTAEPFATVSIYEDGTLLGTTTAGGTGSWTKALTFLRGTHVIYAIATDRAGNPSLSSALVTFEVTVDPPPPLIVTITSPSEGAFVPATFSVGGAAQTSVQQVLIYDNGFRIATATATDGVWSGTVTLTNGTHRLTARGQNGPNVGPVSNARTVKVDGVAPKLSISKPPGYILFQFTLLFPTVEGTAEELRPFDSGVARIDLVYTNLLTGDVVTRTATCPCPGTDIGWEDTPDLALGLWTLEARAVDVVGNVSPPSTLTLLSLGV